MLNTPYQYTLSIHPINTHSQHTLAQYTLSMHPIKHTLNTPYLNTTYQTHSQCTLPQYTLSMHPIQERPPSFVVVLFSRGMSGADMAAAAKLRDVKVLSFEELLSTGNKEEFQPVLKNAQSTATLVYTSGTTAQPKGAMLSHSNLLYHINFNTFGRNKDPLVNDVFLSILPVSAINTTYQHILSYTFVHPTNTHSQQTISIHSLC